MSVGETPSLIGGSVGEAHGILEHIQAHPPGYQHLKRQNPHVESEGAMESGAKAEQASKQHCTLSGPSPTYKATMQQHGLP